MSFGRVQLAGVGTIEGKYGVFVIRSGETQLRQFNDPAEANAWAGKEFTRRGGTVYIVEMLSSLAPMPRQLIAEWEFSMRNEAHNE